MTQPPQQSTQEPRPGHETGGGDEFLSRLSHEIRTPLNGVLGTIDLLLRCNLNARQERIAHDARQSSETLLGIVNNMLDFSRIQAGELDLEPEPLDINELVEEVAAGWLGRARRKGIEVLIDVADPARPRLLGNDRRIRQVLDNLISNAIKFTDSGTIRIQVDYRPGGENDKGQLTCSVEDTGVGMEPGRIARVLKPADSAPSGPAQAETADDGVGLGLNITRQLVERMGGHMHAVSQPGVGSRFTFELPVARWSEDSQDIGARQPLFQGVRLLIVDDHAEFALLLERRLTRLGFEVSTAFNAMDALTILREDSPSPVRLAIIDDDLLGTSGGELARRIRALPKMSRLDIVLLTPGEPGEQPAYGSEAGIGAVLSKPPRDRHLCRTLERLLTEAPSRGEDSAASPSARPVSGPRRVLVVEDNLINRKVIAAHLKSLDCAVDLVVNGELAVKAISEADYDLIFMDCMMPVMDGISAARAIRGQGHGEIPIVALTADVSPETRSRCLDAGMNDFMTKPFNNEQLNELLEKWLPRVSAPVLDPGADTNPGDNGTGDTGTGDSETKDGGAEGIFKPSALDELRMLGERLGKNLHGKALGQFLESLDEQIAQLRSQLSTGDRETLHRAAHSLKSSSAQLGAVGLSRACAELEAACTTEEAVIETPKGLGALVDACASAAERVRPHLEAALHSAATAAAGLSNTPSAPQVSASPPDTARRSTILVVDDDPLFRDTMTAALEAEGYHVIAATGGEQALSLAADSVPSLVLLDAVMEGMDGFEACRRLLGTWGDLAPPILMTTGLDDLRSVESSFEAGASGFVNKPIKMPELLHRIRFQMRADEDRRKLKQSQEQLDRAQRLARLGYWTWDMERDEMTVSDQLGRMLGARPGELRTLRDYLMHIHPQDRAQVERGIRDINTQGQPESLDFRVARGSGSALVLHQTLDEPDTRRRTLTGTVQDVTHQREAETTIRNLAFRDTLTGLASRAYFQNHLTSRVKGAARRGEQLGLLYMDLDGFKDINDSLGHDVGDSLLTTVAARIQEQMRGSDVAARLGGDEFCVLLDPITDGYDAANIAERLLEVINAPVQLGKQQVNPRLSIGIAQYPTDGEEPTTLLKAADSAMYAAKQSGKHRYAFYEPTMTTSAEHRLQLEHDLRLSIERDELTLVYQPQVNLTDHGITGVEALVRWNHPTLGTIPPNEFIGLAERIGFIDALGEWVMRTACTQLVEWMDAGMPRMRMAVNIAPSHFQNPRFCATVAAILEETGCPPGQLELEVTESVFEARDQCVSVFETLHGMGVKIAVDDFGAGYSSLSSLKHIPLDYLKIDRLFVRDMLSDTNSATLTGTMVGLGHALGCEVVAEGAEELAQIQALHGMDCDVVQGYFFSPPVKPEEIPKMANRSYGPDHDGSPG
ncbi:MAG: EAL domain-containing protein [Gammaproteobacteria bacterium]